MRSPKGNLETNRLGEMTEYTTGDFTLIEKKIDNNTTFFKQKIIYTKRKINNILPHIHKKYFAIAILVVLYCIFISNLFEPSYLDTNPNKSITISPHYVKIIKDGIKASDTRHNSLVKILGNNYTVTKTSSPISNYVDDKYSYLSHHPETDDITRITDSIDFVPSSNNNLYQKMHIYLNRIKPGEDVKLDSNFSKILTSFSPKLTTNYMSEQMKQACNDYYQIKKDSKTFTVDDMDLKITIYPQDGFLYLSISITLYQNTFS